ncbi:MAG: fumarate hydratase [Opitutales bacterium]
MPTPDFHYQPMLPLQGDTTEYTHLTSDFVTTTTFNGREVLQIEPQALTYLSREAFKNISFFLRSKHIQMVADILDDPDASDNDRNVALTLLRNAEVSAQGELPFCQDTGTATIVAKKGQAVWTGVDDAEYLSKGVYDCYTEENLRYSQMAPLDMWTEKNTGCNLPAQIDLFATPGDSYEFLFVAKGGGSANKMFLYQETKALLNPDRLMQFVIDKMSDFGTSACPPYHIAIVIGGTSAEMCLKTTKLASTKYLDNLPTSGNEYGHAFRDKGLEAQVLERAHQLGIGAQFGGKYFALDVRIIRCPRHGASCPVGMAVSCSADRQAKAKITKDGLFLEKLETDPGRFIPAKYQQVDTREGAVKIDLNRPMDDICAELSQYPVTTRLSLSGTIIVARDIAHAKLKEMLDGGDDLPQYVKDHPIYYAGPAKTPRGMPSGSFGPTTAGRMDSYVDLFQSHGASRVMLAKGNRSKQVTEACQKHGGFYLGSIGGPAAILAKESIKAMECVAFPELGMEAIWKIEVEDFPAFIIIDDKGNDFFAQIREQKINAAY